MVLMEARSAIRKCRVLCGDDATSSDRSRPLALTTKKPRRQSPATGRGAAGLTAGAPSRLLMYQPPKHMEFGVTWQHH
jgi:hypothetical protein